MKNTLRASSSITNTRPKKSRKRWPICHAHARLLPCVATGARRFVDRGPFGCNEKPQPQRTWHGGTSYDPIESGLISREAHMKLVNGRGRKQLAPRREPDDERIVGLP